jgi:hypothetical protein
VGDSGRFRIVVRRSISEQLTEGEKDRMRTLFLERKCLAMIVPAPILMLCIRKLRTPKKYDYAEFTMAKHLTWILRSVLGLREPPAYRVKRRK